jgi:hypothetical protein
VEQVVVLGDHADGAPHPGWPHTGEE